jgi:hypothetical protein
MGSSKRSHFTRAPRARPENRPSQPPPNTPDLEPIRSAFADAHAIIRTAARVLDEFDQDREAQDMAATALLQGIQAFEGALDRLERAEIEVRQLLGQAVRDAKGGAE